MNISMQTIKILEISNLLFSLIQEDKKLNFEHFYGNCKLYISHL